MRRCRNRSYTKVNHKRRQHLQASLSTYLQIEWHKNFPDSKLTGKTLLQAYVEHFETDENSHDSSAVINVRGRGSRGGRRGMRGRRGRYEKSYSDKYILLKFLQVTKFYFGNK